MKHEIFNRHVCHQLCIRQIIAYSFSQCLKFSDGYASCRCGHVHCQLPSRAHENKFRLTHKADRPRLLWERVLISYGDCNI